MLGIGQAVHRSPTMASPSRNHYTSPTTEPAEVARSRQNSDAMDIYGIADRELADQNAADSETGNRNGSPSMSSTYSKNSETPAFYEENGRTYHGFRKGVYMLPCDEQEQDRLDIFHKLLTEARKSDGLIYAPHRPNGRFLDLGCGTGIWAIDVAHKYPDATVVGVDLAPIQPPNHPRNCEFYAPFDFEAPWAMGEDHWDLIHLQMGCGSVVGWPNLYRKIFAHLKPGCWFEQVEIDFEPRCNNRPLEKMAFWHWYQYLKQATQDAMHPIAHNSHETIKHLEEAGFTQINHQIVGLPLNPWIPDKHESRVARWYNLAISESIETLSLAPFSRIYHWPLDKIKRISDEVKSEAFNPDIHAWNLLHIYQAQKPPN
ncbi:class I SAM-dependent methyltransferase [Aspergillus homomorphus CBS 101889]|uniref:Velvet complex subunit laeA n=1 Tax=Aspergillus homomorphus (strain CBS 101889) TaxID=1450537 RepID=A0A395IA32_ASPHC|nr:putative methyltransferase [Aspergillus homomorphus CBS 101889]RAL16659.1 putative methyltransferase [Aspergillus homomorphus CBS 101889]